jgi:hypothetical protein
MVVVFAPAVEAVAPFPFSEAIPDPEVRVQVTLGQVVGRADGFVAEVNLDFGIGRARGVPLSDPGLRAGAQDTGEASMDSL